MAQLFSSPSKDVGLISRAITGAWSWQWPQARDAVLLVQASGGLECGAPSLSYNVGILAGLREAAGRNLAGTKAAIPGVSSREPAHLPWWSFAGCMPPFPMPLALLTQAEVPPCDHVTLTGIPS